MILVLFCFVLFLLGCLPTCFQGFWKTAMPCVSWKNRQLTSLIVLRPFSQSSRHTNQESSYTKTRKSKIEEVRKAAEGPKK